VHHPRSVGDGRFITRYGFNQLDQVVILTSSLPFGFVTRREYDPNGGLEREESDAKDDAGADIPDAPEVRTFQYDEQLNLLRSTIGGHDITRHLVTQYC